LLSLFGTGRSAKIFCFAAACPFIMLFIQILTNAGYITDRFLNEHGVLIANLLDIFILLSGIIYNIWDKERSRDEQLRLLEEDRRETLKKLIMVQDHERKRIAEELHDSIGPLLAAIRINFLRSVKAEREQRSADALIAKTENIIDDSIGEIRNIAHQLMPKGLSSKGLVTLLTEYFDDLRNIYSVKIEFGSDITTALNGDIQLNLYRIISELVLNAAKHSRANVIAVSMETPDHEIRLSILDDGIGFSPVQKASGLGLKSIESRVSYLKGIMEIKTSPGDGSCIKITIPHQDN
jgi:signal transduction histidine kinase